MPAKDSTCDKALSYHMNAIPMIQARPNGFDLLETIIIDMSNNYSSVTDSFITTGVGFFIDGAVRGADSEYLSSLTTNIETLGFLDFMEAANQV